MWIRSQDKKQLVNANDLYIATRGKGYTISTCKGNDLGTYSSEEKAIKVLDMIEYPNYYLTNKGQFVAQKAFDMPQDSEVEQ